MTPFQNCWRTSHLCAILLFNLPYSLLAQPYYFKHIDRNEGLSQSNVTVILQDQKGFMWFGTRDGLNRYDGYDITIYRNDPKNPASISHNYIRELYEDSHGRLWIGTDDGGLSLYNRSTDDFTNYKHEENNPVSLSHNKVKAIYEDDKGGLWIGTGGGGINLFDYEKGRFTCFRHSAVNENSLSSNDIEDIVADDAGILWIATWDAGLNAFNVQSGQFTRFQSDEKDVYTISSNYLKKLYLDSGKKLWIGTTEGGINYYNRESNEFTRYTCLPGKPNGLNNNDVLSIAEDKHGNLWIGTQNGGINILHRESQTFSHIVYNEQITQGLNNGSIYSLYRDRQNNMWVGTFSGGVNFRDSTPPKFMHFAKTNQGSAGLNNNNVLSIWEKDGLLFLGTDGGGLNIYNERQNQFTYFLNKPGNKNSIRSDYPLCIYESSDGNLWIGGFYGKVSIYDTKTGQFDNLHFEVDVNHVAAICEDKEGKMWMGTWGNGLVVYEKEDSSFRQYLPDATNPQSISHNVIFSIFEDSRNNLWVGTEGGGLNLFDREKGAFLRYQYSYADASSISNNIVNTIFEDSSGNLWIGTSGGLNRLKSDDMTFESFTTKDGLPNNVVQAIVEDDHGKLWLSTNNGVTRFDPLRNSFRNYDVSDGLQGNSFNRMSCFKNRKGEIYFGGINGFNLFHPDSIKDNDYVPEVYFTGLQVFNKPVTPGSKDSPLLKHISETSELVLSYKQSVVSLEFAALNYSLPEKNQYAYKLVGFDESWNYVGTQRKATYTNLDPGKYLLQVKAANNDGLWNEKGRAIKIIITPPFWKSWWAKSAYVFLAIGFLFIVRAVLIQRMKVTSRLEMDEMKLRFYANISHEFRTPLTLILGPLNQLTSASDPNPEKRQLLTLMQKNGQRLLKLINQLMHIYELDAGFMKLKAMEGDLVVFCKAIKEAFQYVAEKKHIDYVYSSNVVGATSYFDHDKLEKILLNLLSNAFKYTPDRGHVTVSVSVFNDDPSEVPAYIRKRKRDVRTFAQIAIADSGEGIAKEFQGKVFDRFSREQKKKQPVEGSGIGLSLARQLARLHYGDIVLESEPGKGSTFIIWLPVAKEAFQVSEIHANDYDVYVRLPDLQTAYGIPDDLPEKTAVEKEEQKLPILLVVEDNKDIRAYLKQNFSSTFRIEEAENGKEGMEKAIEVVPDIIVSDVMMPVMDGAEMCSLLKKNVCTSHIPILLLTAKAEESFQLRAYSEMLADDFISKPFNVTVLHAKLRNMLQSRELLKKKLFTTFISTPSEPAIPDVDEAFLKKAVEIVEDNIDDPAFNVEKFCRDMGMSQTNMYRKLQSLLGLSGNQFLKDIRMKRAIQLLSSNQFPVSEVAYRVGFSDAKYFSQSFKKQFGMLPTEYWEKSQKAKSPT